MRYSIRIAVLLEPIKVQKNCFQLSAAERGPKVAKIFGIESLLPASNAHSFRVRMISIQKHAEAVDEEGAGGRSGGFGG